MTTTKKQMEADAVAAEQAAAQAETDGYVVAKANPNTDPRALGLPMPLVHGNWERREDGSLVDADHPDRDPIPVTVGLEQADLDGPSREVKEVRTEEFLRSGSRFTEGGQNDVDAEGQPRVSGQRAGAGTNTTRVSDGGSAAASAPAGEAAAVSNTTTGRAGSTTAAPRGSNKS